MIGHNLVSFLVKNSNEEENQRSRRAALSHYCLANRKTAEKLSHSTHRWVRPPNLIAMSPSWPRQFMNETSGSRLTLNLEV